MVFAIGWPEKNNRKRTLLCLIGLFLCPYYLWLSGRLYTEMIACFWVLIGMYGHFRKRYILSCVAFVLAISSRQYMLAFPAAIAAYEFSSSIVESMRLRRIWFVHVQKWLSPLIASLSILGWIYLFQGLATQASLLVREEPAAQQTTWAIAPGGAINFLSFVGFYIVIPEFFLFRPRNILARAKQHRLKVLCIAIALACFCLIFPPLFIGSGNIIKLANMLPNEVWKIMLYYSLSLLACLRFSQPSLLSTIVLFNSLIMMKAYSWDRYVLPLVVVFWFLKSKGFGERQVGDRN